MLQPNNRKLLFDALAPPPGYRLDWTVGTSYTLDLIALLAAPVAFAFSDWQDNEGRPTPDPLAMLKAVRQYADRMCLFCQAGRIHVPAAYQPLVASLESSIVEALAPKGGSFHPKVWFLRFSDEEGDVMYRFLCLSRNMTFDRAWDTMLCLDGRLTERVNAFSRNHPLGLFAEALPAMSIRGLSSVWKQRMNVLAHEIRRVAFETPEDIDELAFWPIGIDANSTADDDWPFASSDNMLVVSPFVSDTLLTDLTKMSDQVRLISRAEQLELLDPETLENFADMWILDDAAEPEAAELEQEPDGDLMKQGKAASEIAPLVGLHAKAYVLDDGWNASIFTGSANATHAAFHQNVEFLTELRGKKSKIGVAAMLGEEKGSGEKKTVKGVASLADMLQPFKSTEDAEPADDATEHFERYVDRLSKQVAASLLLAHCDASADGEGFRVRLGPSKPVDFVLTRDHAFSVRPASLPNSSPLSIALREPTWASFESLSMLSLTTFFVFTVTVDQPRKMTGEFVLNVPLVGEPGGRREALLKHLLSDKARVLRFMMLLLSDADASAFADLLESGDCDGSGLPFSSMLDGQTLFESLMRCVDRDPARLKQVAEMISDLASTAEGKSLLPDDIDSIWQPIWAVAQRELSKTSERGRAL